MHLLLAVALAAFPIDTKVDKCLKYSGSCTGGEVITALPLTSTQYTGWIYTNGVDDLVFLTQFTFSAATSVSMTCKSAMDNTGANGTGYDVPQWTMTGPTTAPVIVGGPVTWTYGSALAADADFAIVFKNVTAMWVNCAFTGGGTPAAGDLITVTVHGVSP